MSASYTTKQYWALGVVGLACLIVVSTSFFVYQKLISTTALARHSREIMDESEHSLMCLLDCETAYRGFLLTNDETFLEPYKTCYEHALEHVNRVRQLTEDNQSQQARMPRLVQLAQEKIRFTQMAIEWRKEHPEIFSSQIPLRQGKAIMDEFRKTIGEIELEEGQILTQRRQEVDASKVAVLITLSISGAIIIASLFWIGLSSRRYVREQAQIGAALQAARDEAIQANRLKTQFVANISHEIRTPLSGILGLSELLTSYNLESASAELVQHIYTSAQTLVGLVSEILDFSKLDAGRLELSYTSFKIPMVVEQVRASCMVQADNKGIALTTKIDESLQDLQVCGDFGRVRQVLLNIVYNAIKFTANGEVKVLISNERVSENQVFVRFQVADTGIGIDEEKKRNLFEPFVQADGSTTRKYGGTGLGLSISLSLVHLMHGQIDCFKNENGGATFWFTLPFEFGPETTCSKSESEVKEKQSPGATAGAPSDAID